MRCLIVILAILGLGLGDTAPELHYEDESLRQATTYIFESIVEGILKNLSETLAVNDPITLPNVTFNINNENLTLDFNATDVQIKGYSQFAPSNLSISLIPPAIKFNLVFSGIELVVPHYDLNALLIFVPLYGKGSADIKIGGINLGASADVSISLAGIKGISNLNLTLSLAETTVNITGLLYNEPFSAIVSAAATDFITSFINNHHERLEELLGPLVENLINQQLGGSFMARELPADLIDSDNTIHFDDDTYLKYNLNEQ